MRDAPYAIRDRSVDGGKVFQLGFAVPYSQKLYTLLAAARSVLICRKANSTTCDQNFIAKTADKVGPQ